MSPRREPRMPAQDVADALTGDLHRLIDAAGAAALDQAAYDLERSAAQACAATAPVPELLAYLRARARQLRGAHR